MTDKEQLNKLIDDCCEKYNLEDFIIREIAKAVVWPALYLALVKQNKI